MTPSANTASQDESALLSALTAELEHSYQLAERLDAKTQRSATFAGAFFALVQAAAINNLLKTLSHWERVVLLLMSLAALLSLALAGIALLRQEKLLTVGDLPLKKIEEMIDGVFGEKETTSSEVNRTLASIYAGMARSRRQANGKRIASYKLARIGFGITILLTSFELGWALFSRIPGVDI